jgi:hypothetical protein
MGKIITMDPATEEKPAEEKLMFSVYGDGRSLLRIQAVSEEAKDFETLRAMMRILSESLLADFVAERVQRTLMETARRNLEARKNAELASQILNKDNMRPQ